MTLISAPAVAIPQDVRADLAWQDVRSWPDNNTAPGFTYRVPGESYDELLAASWIGGTDATIATRQFAVSFLDEGGNVLLRVPFPSTQAASSTIFYNVTVGESAGVAVVGAMTQVFVPKFVLAPGYQIGFYWVNKQPGDTMTQIRTVMTRIPSGPRQAAPVRLATPLLV